MGFYRAALALSFLSGSAGLTHQLLWTRRLVDLLGADADTFARVIGAFFAGLALGAWCASRSAAPGTNFWRRIFYAELGVAGLAVPVLVSAEWADWVWSRPGFEQWIPFLAPPLLVLPPALFMGLVLPWVLRALADQGNANRTVRLYAANLMGGIAGIVLVMGFGLPRIGLFLSGAVAIGLNLIAALIAAALAYHGPSMAGPSPAASATLSDTGHAKWVGRGLAFVSGFLVLAAEVVVQHQFAQVTINSMFSTATVLGIALTALLVGAFGVQSAIQWFGNERRLFAVSLWLAACCWAIQPFILVGLTGGLRMLTYEMPPVVYTLQVAALAIVTVGLPFAASGVVFPLVLRTAAKHPKGSGHRELGLLLAWNGLGGWMGAELASGWMAPTAGLWGSLLWIALIYWLLALGAAGPFRGKYTWAPVRGWLGLAVGGVGLAVAALFVGSLPHAGIQQGERVLAVEVSREGVAVAVERRSGDRRILFNNAYSLGGSRSQFNQERQALLPLLLHGEARAAALLGVATGSTTAGAALHSDLRQIDAIELSPAVLRLARDYFGPYNRNVFHDPRVRVIEADARQVMARKRDAYDVVIGDLYLPWRTGEGRLFTLEHFQNVRASLRTNGLYCQWLPLFQLTRDQYDVITRTFRTVFPDAFLIRGDFYAERPIVGLVGGRTVEGLAWDRIDAACVLLRMKGQTSDPLARHTEGVAMMVVGPLPQMGPGPINTLANAWIEWDAGHNILGRQNPWFVGVPLGEYMRGLHRTGASLLPEHLRAAHDAGQFFLTLEMAAHIQHSTLGDLTAQTTERLPNSMATDTAAIWRAWPMRAAGIIPPIVSLSPVSTSN